MEGTNKTNTNSPQKSVNSSPNRNDGIYKGTIIVLVLIIAVLTFMLITSRQALQDVSTEKTLVDELNGELKTELDSVLNEYNLVKMEYDSVLTTQDSIIQANALEIQQLIAEQGDYRRIRRQLNLLREITQNYVHEIDSLYTENKVLKAENVEMQQEIRRFTAEASVLEETKIELESKVEVASALRAFQIDATPMRLRGSDREEPTDRARRTDRVKVCFVVAGNPVAQAGNKNAYIRIADPEGNILRISDDNRYSFVIEGDTLQFTMKGDFNYANQDTEVCLYWDKTNDFQEGMYMVSIFTDEFRLGESQFSLR